MPPRPPWQLRWYGPGTYRIRVQGALRPAWSDRLGGMRIRGDPRDPACTVLEGRLPDQAALLGVLKGLHDLGMPLLLVECVDGDTGDNGEAQPPTRGGA